nr:hypothetical protein [Abalone asfa-like virus]
MNIAKVLGPGSELIDVFKVWLDKGFRPLSAFFPDEIKNFKSIELGKASIIECTEYKNQFQKSLDPVIYFVGADTSDRNDRGFPCKMEQFEKSVISYRFDAPKCLIGYYHNKERAILARDLFNERFAGKEVKVLGVRMVRTPVELAETD